jgi:hypothetical protein
MTAIYYSTVTLMTFELLLYCFFFVCVLYACYRLGLEGRDILRQ